MARKATRDDDAIEPDEYPSQLLDPLVEWVPLDSIQPHPDNPRQGDVGAIVESIRAHWFYQPCLVQRSTRFIVAGNHRWRALRLIVPEWLGFLAACGHDVTGLVVLVPVVVRDLTDDQARRILLVDNRTSDLATYDDRGLADLLKDLAESTGTLDGTGFGLDDLDQLLADMDSPLPWTPPPPDDPLPKLPKKPRTKAGDLWELGPHRLICGDCRIASTVDKLLDGATINMAFTSPPYAQQRTYDETSGFVPIPPDEYVEWFAPVAANVAAHLAPDGSWFVNIKPSAEGLDTSLYVFDLVLAHVREWGWHFATEFCWERNGVPKSVTQRFKNQFEPVYQFARGRWKMRPDEVRYHSDNVPKAYGPGAGDTGWAGSQGGNGAMFGNDKARTGTTPEGSDRNDYQGTNWQPGEMIGPGLAYPGNRLPTMSGSHEALGHTAAFPVGLPEWFIRAYTDEGDVVFDPFMGSGSTLIAADRQCRIGYGIELSPAYCDVICERFERATGTVPVRRGKAVSFV